MPVMAAAAAIPMAAASGNGRQPLCEDTTFTITATNDDKGVLDIPLPSNLISLSYQVHGGHGAWPYPMWADSIYPFNEVAQRNVQGLGVGVSISGTIQANQLVGKNSLSLIAGQSPWGWARGQAGGRGYGNGGSGGPSYGRPGGGASALLADGAPLVVAGAGGGLGTGSSGPVSGHHPWYDIYGAESGHGRAGLPGGDAASGSAWVFSNPYPAPHWHPSASVVGVLRGGGGGTQSAPGALGDFSLPPFPSAILQHGAAGSGGNGGDGFDDSAGVNYPGAYGGAGGGGGGGGYYGGAGGSSLLWNGYNAASGGGGGGSSLVDPGIIGAATWSHRQRTLIDNILDEGDESTREHGWVTVTFTVDTSVCP